MKCTDIF